MLLSGALDQEARGWGFCPGPTISQLCDLGALGLPLSNRGVELDSKCVSFHFPKTLTCWGGGATIDNGVPGWVRWGGG